MRVSPKITNPMMGGMRNTARNGRWELKNTSMVDLIRLAYGFENDKVLGGPNWLEMDRFDITAKVPGHSTADSRKEMLQALLAERFKLVLHKDTKPLPAYALQVAKKPNLKEADGSGDVTGCKPRSAALGSGPSTPGEVRVAMSMNGSMTTLTLGPGMTIQFECRNMTMDAFAEGFRTMIGSGIGTHPVLNETGLEGRWNFDVKWSMGIIGPMAATGEHISASDALEKRLGLKLVEKQVPTPVIVVDSVNRTPTPNPPGTDKALPPVPVPTEFDVASVKPADPGARGGRFNTPPGGRLDVQGMNLRFLVMRAFNVFNSDELVGLPEWANSERFDITAKAPVAGAIQLDPETLAPLLRALLADRFKMTYHTEDRPMTAYTLAASKPKMKKADPATRTNCRYQTPTPPGIPPGSRVMICQNISMEEFTERLRGMAPELAWPVTNSTGLEGGWDFTLVYNPNLAFLATMAAAGRGAPAGAAQSGEAPGAPAVQAASDPIPGYTLFEALEKQLGLKLEKQKRSLPIIVIDHIEQKPTEN